VPFLVPPTDDDGEKSVCKLLKKFFFCSYLPVKKFTGTFGNIQF